jgi:hypothetical protein
MAAESLYFARDYWIRAVKDQRFQPYSRSDSAPSSIRQNADVANRWYRDSVC